MAYRYYPADGAENADQPHVHVLTKGAFERVFERCTHVLMGKGSRPLSSEDKQHVQKHYDQLAAQGLRVLTLCGRKEPTEKAEDIRNAERDVLEHDMCFYGLAGI